MNNRLNCEEALEELSKKSRHLAALSRCFDFIPDQNIPTACVEFSRKEGNPLRMKFNPTFWSKMNGKEKAAIIAHEMLHIALNHGFRMQIRDSRDVKIQNIAMDICVNGILKSQFGIDETFAPILSNAVYAHKIDETLDEDRCYEYYFRYLKENPDKEPSGTSLDAHEWMSEISSLTSGQDKNIIDKIVNALKKSGMSQSEIKKFLQNLRSMHSMAGTSPGRLEVAMDGSEEETKKYTQWQKVLRKIKKVFEEQNCNEENWFEQPRRRDYDADYFLPSQETKADRNKKRHIHIFMDTSGSCGEWLNTFMGSSLAFPQDNFEVHLYCFDTEVYPVNKKAPKLKGFGGTSFRSVSDYVNENIKKYDCIIVLTDGYGDSAKYKKPNLWHWVLTTDYTDYVPQFSKIHKLNEILIKAC